MKKLLYSIEIAATPEKVWETLWNKDSYKIWADHLAKGSYYEGTMAEGTKVHIYDPERNGMYNLVEKNIPNREMSFKNLGWIMNGEEVPQDFGGSGNSYLLDKTENGTKLSISIDAKEEYVSFYDAKMNAALEQVKALAEE